MLESGVSGFYLWMTMTCSVDDHDRVSGWPWHAQWKIMTGSVDKHSMVVEGPVSHDRWSNWNQNNPYKTNQGTWNIFGHQTIVSKIQFQTVTHVTNSVTHVTEVLSKNTKNLCKRLFSSHLYMNRYTPGAFISKDFTGLAKPCELDRFHDFRSTDMGQIHESWIRPGTWKFIV